MSFRSRTLECFSIISFARVLRKCFVGKEPQHTEGHSLSWPPSNRWRYQEDELSWGCRWKSRYSRSTTFNIKTKWISIKKIRFNYSEKDILDIMKNERNSTYQRQSITLKKAHSFRIWLGATPSCDSFGCQEYTERMCICPYYGDLGLLIPNNLHHMGSRSF